MKKKTCIISDLHLGADNAPKSIHNLVRFLNTISHHDRCRLVILGDFLDRWALSIKTKPLPYHRLVKEKPHYDKVIKALKTCS